jgi:hypothetical protein
MIPELDERTVNADESDFYADVRAYMQAPGARVGALSSVWYPLVRSSTAAFEMARADLVPEAGQDDGGCGVQWNGSTWQCALVAPAVRKEMARNEIEAAWKRRGVGVNSYAARDYAKDYLVPDASGRPVKWTPDWQPIDAPETTRERTPAVERETKPIAIAPPAKHHPGKAEWFDMVPKALVRDRRLSAESVRLYAVLLDASNNKTRIAYPSQKTLGDWMGWPGRGGRNRVRRALKKLLTCGYVEELVKGRRMGVQGASSRYRVRVGELPLAAEHDLRNEGGLQ